MRRTWILNISVKIDLVHLIVENQNPNQCSQSTETSLHCRGNLQHCFFSPVPNCTSLAPVTYSSRSAAGLHIGTTVTHCYNYVYCLFIYWSHKDAKLFLIISCFWHSYICLLVLICFTFIYLISIWAGIESLDMKAKHYNSVSMFLFSHIDLKFVLS